MEFTMNESQPRLWLTSMSNGGSLDNIREMIDPITQYLDGIVWVMHDANDADAGSVYLAGLNSPSLTVCVIHRHYTQRNFHSMNETLFAGLIAENDYVIWTDALERPMPAFVSRIKGEIAPQMESQGIDALAYYGKIYLFRYNETMQYHQSPHWFMTGYRRVAEYSQVEPDETKVRFNARPIKRGGDPYHWVRHYLYYHLFPAGSNSALLGLDTYGDPQTLFIPREARRLEFRREVLRRGYPLTVDGVREMLKNPLDTTLKSHINGDKVISDFYRYEILGDKTVAHSHDPKEMKRIE